MIVYLFVVLTALQRTARAQPTTEPTTTPGSADGPAAAVSPTPDAPSSPAPTAAVSGAAAAPVDILVQGHSRSEQLRRSSLPVTVVELQEQRRSSIDLGEVLARTQGVSVQRTGGLGSEQRFSLNGLENEQIRFFLDGIPLDLAGYPFGVSDMPVNTLERIEIYSGVVPIRFGADALGGAVQLITRRPTSGAHASASYQAGSFDTHRATLSAGLRDPQTGWLAQLTAFGDSTENNYRVTLDVPDDMGTAVPTRVHLFHAAYRAGGIHATAGVVDRPWAEALTLRAFASALRREIQNDPTMNEPYGAPVQKDLVTGATLHYAHTIDALHVDASGGYNFEQLNLRNLGSCIYDWFGRCSARRVMPGEIASLSGVSAYDAIYDTHTGFARANGTLHLGELNAIALSLAPTYAARSGDERKPRNPDAPDLLNSERRVFSFVAGLEHQLRAVQDRLQTSVFAKQYLQTVRTDEILRNGDAVPRDRDSLRFGAGASARFAFTPELWVKGSYEYATRLPALGEIFGDGVLIEPNLQLAPEISHNANLTLGTALLARAGGDYRLEVTGFVRDADQLITLLSGTLTQRYSNVARARSIGVQASGSWTSPGGYFGLDANTTYQDFRNRSQDGPFATFYGDRVTNRPYFFATGQARVQLPDVVIPRDRVALTWVTRYTHAFYRTWESLGGDSGSRQQIDPQLVHSLGVSYLVRSRAASSLSVSVDLQNISDARVFDAYGVERPGRAIYFKTTAEL